MTSSGNLDPIRPLFYKFGTMTVYDQFILASLAYDKDKLDSFRQLHCKRGCLSPFFQHRKKKCTLAIPRCYLSKTLDGFPVLVLEDL